MENNCLKYDDVDIAIIGGGAAGLTAAIFAARINKNAKIAVIEKNNRSGKKILATGDGRCNLSNKSLEFKHQITEKFPLSKYHTSSNYKHFDPYPIIKKLFQSALSATDFFNTLGVKTISDNEGRIYPHSLSSASITDALRLECEKLEVMEITSFFVDDIQKQQNNFVISSAENTDGEKSTIKAKKVILSTGSPASSSGNSSFSDLPKKPGVKSLPFFPALCPISLNQKYISSLKGLRVRANCKILKNNPSSKKIHLLAEEFGEVQFGSDYISGICILNLSHYISSAENKDFFEVSLDLTPDLDICKLLKFLEDTKKSRSDTSLENYLTGLFQKRICIEIIKSALPQRKINSTIANLNNQDIKALSEKIKDWRFPVTGTAKLERAQCAGGGVPFSELSQTLQVNNVKGFFVAGEAVDIHGDCGGYNLAWAWVSGEVAGRAAANSLFVE